MPDKIVNTIVNIKVCRDDDDLSKYVRSLFAFDDYADCVPINAANLSVTFNAVQVSMNAMALGWNRDISIQKRIKPFVFPIQAARNLIASQLNIEPDLLAFCRNGSDPNAVINNGLDFNPGDEVVVNYLSRRSTEVVRYKKRSPDQTRESGGNRAYLLKN